MESDKKRPLADRIRPNDFFEFFGQEELVGEKAYLKKVIEEDSIPSLIFWGPPGSGKTTLALIIAQKTKSVFLKLSAVSSGKKDLLEVFKKAQENKKKNKKTILFLDEIHRWNKSQQDALLPSVEKGLIILIGATTENPSFEINSALISRSRVFIFSRLSERNVEKIIYRALKFLPKKIKIKANEVKLLAQFSNGDARMAINTLEAASMISDEISGEVLTKVLQKKHLLYDKNGEEHYNIISALHKSMRAGDVSAALYWLSRMIEGGEDPLYIARRLVRFASEDIGLANNTALLLANAVFDACHKLGFPECSVHLSQCVIYLSKSKKDITSYIAYEKAKKDVLSYGNLSVPLHLRNAPNDFMKKIGYGRDYKYPPFEKDISQKYLPKEIENHKYI